MAQQDFKIDVRDANFPLLAEQQTRTIIELVRSETPTKEDLVGIQYCHNVMPTKEGIESVGFIDAVIPSLDLPPLETFDDTRTVFTTTSQRVTMAWDTAGNPYILVDFVAAWFKILNPPAVSPTFTTNDVTIGTVNGASYIYYKNQACYVLTQGSFTLDEVDLVGIDESVTLGVVGSSGYLVAYTKLEIAWSSTIEPTDFIPSTVTGAGGGSVTGIQGDILFAVSNSTGMLFYTFANVVGASYTGNVQFPWKFRPITDAKGGINLDRVAYEPDTAGVFTYTKAGLQVVSLTKADTILPEVTDFLGGGRFDEYDTTLQEYITTVVPPDTTVDKKVKYIASRYLVISYGINGFTFALIYDLILNRLGKIKLNHVDVFDYVNALKQTEVSKQSIAFLHADGAVSLLNFAVDSPSDGVLILAKLQATRTRLFTLLEVATENVLEGATFSVGSLVSLDGKNGTYVSGKPALVDENIRTHAFKDTGKNHSIVYEGQFNISTALVTYTINGRR